MAYFQYFAAFPFTASLKAGLNLKCYNSLLLAEECQEKNFIKYWISLFISSSRVMRSWLISKFFVFTGIVG
jgi:hypothetical protein